MKLISEALSEIASLFDARQMPHPKRQAEELLCDLLDCSFSQLYHRREEALGEDRWQICQLWVKRRLKGEPLAYLSGKVHFYHCLLEITPAVLIPRPETELLVDRIAARLKKERLLGKVLWDLCCGSGCIGIALKKMFPELIVYLSDRSEEAVSLAARNAEKNRVSVECLKGDLLEPFQGMKADYVVCNPPYISEEEYACLDGEVKNYEPRLALVAGERGLEFYHRLADELPAYLSPGAQIGLELGYQQGETVRKIFERSPWKNQKVEKDWAGHDRFFFLENE